MPSQIGALAIGLVGLGLAGALTGCAPDYSPPSTNSASTSVDATVHTIYRSYKLYNSQINTTATMGVDYYLSTVASDPAATGFNSLGAYMNLLTNSSTSRVQVYNCWTTSSAASLSVVNHYVSIDSGCEGGNVIGPLGYLETQAVSQVTIPVYRCQGSAFQVPGLPTGTQLGSFPNSLVTTTWLDCVPQYGYAIIGYTM